MNQLKALFFPYARIENIKTLNNAVLLFDEINIISPDAFMSSYMEDISSHSQTAKKHLESLKLLMDENVVKLIDPSTVIPRFGEAITEGVFEDLFNDDFMGTCVPYAGASWTLSARKLPQNHDYWLRNLFQNLPEMARDQLLTRKWGGTGNVDFLYKEICFATEIQFKPKAAKEYYRSNVKDKGYTGTGLGKARWYSNFDEGKLSTQSQKSPDLDTRTVTLPFVLGEAIMIGHSLALAAEEGLIPVTDERVHFDAYNSKMKSLAENPGARKLLYEYGYVKETKSSFLGIGAINATLPSLEKVPTESVLKFRNSHNKELEHFRVEMARLATEIESTPWDDEFNKHITDSIDKNILPTIKGIERQIKSNNEKFWSNAVKTVATSAPLPIVGSIWAGIPPIAAVAIGSGVATLSIILEQIAETRSIRRNGLSLLLDAQKLRPSSA